MDLCRNFQQQHLPSITASLWRVNNDNKVCASHTHKYPPCSVQIFWAPLETCYFRRLCVFVACVAPKAFCFCRVRHRLLRQTPSIVPRESQKKLRSRVFTDIKMHKSAIYQAARRTSREKRTLRSLLSVDAHSRERARTHAIIIIFLLFALFISPRPQMDALSE